MISTLTNFSIYYFTFNTSFIERLKRFNAVTSSKKKFTPEQMEQFNNMHYTEFGYYPDNSFQARIQRIYQLIPDDYGVSDPNFSVQGFYHSVLETALKIHAEAKMIDYRLRTEGYVKEEHELLMKKSKEVWDLIHSVPEKYYDLSNKHFWEAYDMWDTSYSQDMLAIMGSWLDLAQKEEMFRAYYLGESPRFEPDILFWQWILFPECIIIILLIFFIFTNVIKNRHFLTILFWTFGALSLNCILRASLYPAPNFFIFEPFYICDTYSSHVKAIFYFLLTLYFLMLESKIDYNDSSPSTKIHLISLLFLSLFTTAVISSFDLFFFYISVEGMSFATILMLVFSGRPKLTSSAAIKYFCLNAFASGCLLFSIVLLYGFCNNTSFTAFVEATHDFVLMPNSFIALVIFFFIFVGFKLALFPLGAWLPSVYGQLDYSTLYLFGLIIKTVLFLVFFRLIIYSFPSMLEYFSSLFLGFGILSLAFGSLAAFAQQNLRKFLAYTSIAHTGSILISLHLLDDLGYIAALQYLFIYVISSSIVFYCLATTYYYKKDGSNIPITVYSIPELMYLKSTSVRSTIALTVSFLSMAGLAPLAGFWAKYSICLVLMSEGLETVTVIFIFFSLISIVYYVQIIRSLWFDSKNLTNANIPMVSLFDDETAALGNLYMFSFLLLLIAYYFYVEAIVYHMHALVESARCVFSVDCTYPVRTTPTVELVTWIENEMTKAAIKINSWLGRK